MATPQGIKAGTGASNRLLSMALIAPVTASFSFGVGLSIGLPLLAIVLDQRGVSASMIGLNSAVAGVAAIIATPFAVPLARRLGTVGALVVSILAMTAAFVGFYVLHPLWTWFVLRLVFHGGLTILFCLSEFWINAAAPADRRGVALGIYGTMLSLGFTLGPVILSVVGTQGFTPFALSSAIMLLTLLPILAGREHQPLVEGKSGGSILHYLWVAPAATFAALVFGAVDSGILSLLPVYGIGVGLSVSTSTFLISALGLGLCVAQIPIGLLADRMDKRLLLFLLTLGSLAVAVAIPFANGNPTALWIGLFCWGALITGLYTVGLALLGARFSGAALASANAAFILLYAVGMLIGPSTMGFGLDTFGPNGIFHVAAGFLTIYAIITVLRLRRDG